MDQNISAFVDTMQSILITTALIMATFQVYFAIQTIKQKSIESIKQKLDISNFARKLKKLTPMEKYVLSRFVIENKTEITLDPTDSAVAWLEAAKIIVASGHTMDNKKTKYKISPFPMKILIENPNLLR